ncbi:hypothetical protein PMIN03_011940 [Paraphaeosphaeria minitans]
MIPIGRLHAFTLNIAPPLLGKDDAARIELPRSLYVCKHVDTSQSTSEVLQTTAHGCVNARCWSADAVPSNSQPLQGVPNNFCPSRHPSSAFEVDAQNPDCRFDPLFDEPVTPVSANKAPGLTLSICATTTPAQSTGTARPTRTVADPSAQRIFSTSSTQQCSNARLSTQRQHEPLPRPRLPQPSSR